MLFLRKVFFLLLCAGIFLPDSSQAAGPVIYKDGSMLDSMVSPDRIDLQVGHSFTPRFSVGLNYARIERNDEVAQLVWPQIAFLMKRWNMDEAQANIYLSGGLGWLQDADQQAALGAFTAQGDYETRRIYTALKSESLLSDDLRFNTVTAQAGFAPYKANFHQLNTWVLGKVTYKSYKNDEVSFAPSLRFFYKRYFVEAGSTFKGDWFVNVMLHF